MRRKLVLILATALVAATQATAGGAVMDAPLEECPNVRPGAHIQTGDTGGTLNFLFRGSDGHRYVATAGHLFADEQTLVWRGDGPTAKINDGTVIGRAVFAWNYNESPADFALIKIEHGVAADPTMCHWGGPTGMNTDVSSDPTVLRLYGNGTGVSMVTPERTMVAPAMESRVIVGALGVAVPGDSGAPFISEDGRAVGVQSFVGWLFGDEIGVNGFSPGNVGIYRLGPQLDVAEKALGIDLKVMTAPLAEG